jgi:hypothetical protein
MSSVGVVDENKRYKSRVERLSLERRGGRRGWHWSGHHGRRTVTDRILPRTRYTVMCEAIAPIDVD